MSPWTKTSDKLPPLKAWVLAMWRMPNGVLSPHMTQFDSDAWYTDYEDLDWTEEGPEYWMEVPPLTEWRVPAEWRPHDAQKEMLESPLQNYVYPGRGF